MSRLARLWATLSAVALLLACSSNSNGRHVAPYSARWVKQQIEAYETKGAVSQVTRKVLYSGEPAYLIRSPCCDKFDYFYDAGGHVLCAPSGGFTGRGDGSCPDVSRPANARDP
jgi:hypothetical protein